MKWECVYLSTIKPFQRVMVASIIHNTVYFQGDAVAVFKTICYDSYAAKYSFSSVVKTTFFINPHPQPSLPEARASANSLVQDSFGFV